MIAVTIRNTKGWRTLFKLMIADDNPYALDALRNVVDWEEFDLSLVGAFLNGQDLLDAAKENIPDVVITDISMPKLNGIALTTALQDISPRIKIVFLSNYSDFEYAQKAVQLHITDYLLKPFEPAQIIAVMKKIVQELCDERLRRFEEIKAKHQVDFYRNLARENYIGKLLYQAEEESLIASKLDELGFPLPDTVQLCVAHILMPAQFDAAYEENSHVIRSILQTHQKPDYELIWLFHSSTDISLLAIYQDPGLDVENLLSQLHIDIEIATGVSAVIGFSSVSNSFSDLGELHTQAMIAATQKDSARSAVISYGEILTKNTNPPQKHSTATLSSYVAKMKDFIHAKYMTPITTNDVSSAVFLSSSYANQCFNAECNCTIYEYITQCRIAQAKKLLAETDIKISSVAELVGYNGKTSFYLAFKRNVGISPAEYRYTCNSLTE